MKAIVWIGSALQDLRAFPTIARQRAGRELQRIQQARAPTDWKPMPSIGPGVAEIRIHADGEYRVLYVARFDEAIYVLHAFEKKTRKTRQRDVETGRRRYAALRRLRLENTS
jgi:phage-related protein